MEVRVRKSKNSTESISEDIFDSYVKKSSEEELLEFVEEQIKKMQAYSNLGNGMPSFYELNEALLNYTNIQCSLISLDVMAKQEEHKVSEEFGDWLSEKYLEARQILNPTSLSAQKWASSKELEMWVRVTYKETYKQYNDKKTAAEMKVAFIRRLLDAWDKQSLVLNRLCKNIEVEAMQLGASVN